MALKYETTHEMHDIMTAFVWTDFTRGHAVSMGMLLTWTVHIKHLDATWAWWNSRKERPRERVCVHCPFRSSDKADSVYMCPIWNRYSHNRNSPKKCIFYFTAYIFLYKYITCFLWMYFTTIQRAIYIFFLPDVVLHLFTFLCSPIIFSHYF